MGSGWSKRLALHKIIGVLTVSAVLSACGGNTGSFSQRKPASLPAPAGLFPSSAQAGTCNAGFPEYSFVYTPAPGESVSNIELVTPTSGFNAVRTGNTLKITANSANQAALANIKIRVTLSNGITRDFDNLSIAAKDCSGNSSVSISANSSANSCAAQTTLGTEVKATGTYPSGTVFSIDSLSPASSAFTINSSTGVVSLTSAPAAGNYTLKIKATYPTGFTPASAVSNDITVVIQNCSGNSSVSISANSSANSCAAQTTLGTEVKATGTYPSGTVFSIDSLSPASSAFTINSSTGVVSLTSAPAAGNYTLKIKATYPTGFTPASAVSNDITVVIQNCSGNSSVSISANSSANSCAAQTTLGTEVKATGTYPSGTVFSIDSLSPASSAFTINSSTGVVSLTSAPAAGNYTLKIKATYPTGFTPASAVSNDITVVIQNCSGNSSVSISANSSANSCAAQTTLGTEVKATGTYPSGTVFSIDSLSPASSAFTINSSTGVVSLTSAPAAGNYTLKIKATYPTGFTPASAVSNDITVVIQNCSGNSSVSISANSSANSCAAQTTLGTEVKATGTYPSGTVFSIDSLSPASSAFTINSSTGVVSLTSAPAAGNYTLKIKATYPTGFTPASAVSNDITVVIQNCSGNSSVSISANSSANSCAAQTTLGTEVKATGTYPSGTVFSIDSLSPASSAFTINSSTGVVSLTSAPAAGNYTLKIKATYPTGFTPASAVSNDITVVIQNCSGNSSVSISANSSANSCAAQTTLGTEVKATGTYPSGTVFSIDSLSPASSAFTINSSTGVVSLTSAPAAGNYTLKIKATYPTGFTPADATSDTITVIIKDCTGVTAITPSASNTSNTCPTTSPSPITFSTTPLTVPTGTTFSIIPSVVVPGIQTDQATADKFEIVQSTLRLRAGQTLDPGVYYLIIRAQNPAGYTPATFDSQVITITINDCRTPSGTGSLALNGIQCLVDKPQYTFTYNLAAGEYPTNIQSIVITNPTGGFTPMQSPADTNVFTFKSNSTVQNAASLTFKVTFKNGQFASYTQQLVARDCRIPSGVVSNTAVSSCENTTPKYVFTYSIGTNETVSDIQKIELSSPTTGFSPKFSSSDTNQLVTYATTQNQNVNYTTAEIYVYFKNGQWKLFTGLKIEPRDCTPPATISASGRNGGVGFLVTRGSYSFDYRDEQGIASTAYRPSSNSEYDTRLNTGTSEYFPKKQTNPNSIIRARRGNANGYTCNDHGSFLLAYSGTAWDPHLYGNMVLYYAPKDYHDFNCDKTVTIEYVNTVTNRVYSRSSFILDGFITGAGDGTVGNPYLVGQDFSKAQWYRRPKVANAYANTSPAKELMEVSYKVAGNSGWDDWAFPFEGNLDGAGFTITLRQPLFSLLAGQVKNLKIIFNPTTNNTGTYYGSSWGALALTSSSGPGMVAGIENVQVQYDAGAIPILNANSVGLMIGTAVNTSIKKSSVNVPYKIFIGTGVRKLGGLLGVADVSAGQSTLPTITESYAKFTVDVNGSDLDVTNPGILIGGITGYLSGPTISNCYAQAGVYDPNNLWQNKLNDSAGIVPRIYLSSSIATSYATGTGVQNVNFGSGSQAQALIGAYSKVGQLETVLFDSTTNWKFTNPPKSERGQEVDIRAQNNTDLISRGWSINSSGQCGNVTWKKANNNFPRLCWEP